MCRAFPPEQLNADQQRGHATHDEADAVAAGKVEKT
jgi:hypothetical protein